MARARAVRLEAGGGCAAAIAPYEMKEVLDAAKTVRVPRAPRHCRELLEWNGQLLPVFDLAAWRTASGAETPARFCAVVAYRPRDGGDLRHGGLALAAFPKVIEADDETACDLPDERWRAVALACFRDGADAVPVLDLERMFETAAGDTAGEALASPPGERVPYEERVAARLG